MVRGREQSAVALITSGLGLVHISLLLTQYLPT